MGVPLAQLSVASEWINCEPRAHTMQLVKHYKNTGFFSMSMLFQLSMTSEHAVKSQCPRTDNLFI